MPTASGTLVLSLLMPIQKQQSVSMTLALRAWSLLMLLRRAGPEPSDNLGNLFERLSDLVSVTTSLDGYLSIDQDLPVAEERTLSENGAAVRDGDS